jgi:hypothetical protein
MISDAITAMISQPVTVPESLAATFSISLNSGSSRPVITNPIPVFINEICSPARFHPGPAVVANPILIVVNELSGNRVGDGL